MSALPPGVESLLRRTAPRLAPEHLRRIGKALDPLPAWSAAALRRAQESVHAPVSRRFAAEMCEAWRTECPEMPGATLSALLCVAAGVAEDMEGRTAVEMVWTGPPTQSVPP
ncbi:MAG TPA: hypothetical protein VF178_13410, partial [Gemmatimonadaceae bacterium]